jgi:hypothetical protein
MLFEVCPPGYPAPEGAWPAGKVGGYESEEELPPNPKL